MEHFSETEWCMENISCWKEEMHDRKIRSPDFPSWRFLLLIRGKSGRKEGMKVRIYSRNDVPPGELSFLCSDGSLIHSQQVTSPGFVVDGPEFEEVLALIREKEEDTLTLRYRFKSEKEYKHQVRTVIDVIDTTFKIDPVALGCGKPISNFKFQKDSEAYNVFLTSVREGNVTQIQLECTNTWDAILFETCVKFLKIGDVLEKYEEKEHIFRDREKWVFFSINERELTERGTTVLLRLKIITGIIHSVACVTVDPGPGKSCNLPPNLITFYPNPCIAPMEPTVASPEPGSQVRALFPGPVDPPDDSVTVLKKDFMCLFQDQDFSDLELKCGGVSVPVHRAVLSARSPVFKRMLSSDMREAASGSVDIEDLDAPTLARFLAFLYTGAVGEDLHADSALKLYYAADKYEVSTLMKECVQCLCADISIVNVCDILSLADKHGDDQLTEVSHSFILKNYYEVLKSQQWMIFMQSETLLAEKTLTHFARKQRRRVFEISGVAQII